MRQDGWCPTVRDLVVRAFLCVKESQSVGCGEDRWMRKASPGCLYDGVGDLSCVEMIDSYHQGRIKIDSKTPLLFFGCSLGLLRAYLVGALKADPVVCYPPSLPEPEGLGMPGARPLTLNLPIESVYDSTLPSRL